MSVPKMLHSEQMAEAKVLMMNPNDLRRLIGLASLKGDQARALLGALGSVAALVGSDDLEGHAAWFDDFEAAPDTAHGVSIRVITARGIITLDYEFSFDGYADARFLPWSRVRALRVIAEPAKTTNVVNAWLETDDKNIEFAGAGDSHRFAQIVGAVMKHLE